MGGFFTSFNEAWEHFLARDEPLEDFLADFPDDPDVVAQGWIFEPTDEVKDAAVDVQRAFAHLDWVKPVPRHFLHVRLAGIPLDALSAGLPFPLSYERVNCFHSAIVVEVRSTELSALHPEPTFLPHMTIGVTTRTHPPEPLRTALLPLRERRLGRQNAAAAKRISFPAARSTVLEPWTVVDVVSR